MSARDLILFIEKLFNIFKFAFIRWEHQSRFQSSGFKDIRFIMTKSIETVTTMIVTHT